MTPFFQSHMDVEPKIGGCLPPKWMVKIMVPKPYEQMDDLGVFYFFWKHPSIFFQGFLLAVKLRHLCNQGMGNENLEGI